MKRRIFIQKVLMATAGAVAATTVTPVFARVGRPASPTSVAGVRRRTRRRTRRRIRRNMTLYSLPVGCSTVRHRGGVKYYYCGGIWYRPAYHGTTVVYIVDDIEDGAATEVEFYE